MRAATIVGVVLACSVAAGRAAAETDDAGAPAPDAAASLSLAPEPPPPAPAALQAPDTDRALPPPSEGAPPIAVGPGDEEAKADFQQSLALPDGSPLRVAGRAGSATFYGFGELDVIRDSTRSFGDAANNFSVLYAGSQSRESQWRLTPCNSRLGMRLSSPEEKEVRGIFLAELGPDYQAGDGSGYFCEGSHLRHFYLALRSPIVDVLLGRYYGLFGWGGKGFLPNTAAFMGVPGLLYHLEPQLRVSHIFRFAPVDFEIAIAFGETPQRDPATGEGTLALRLSVNQWRGASAQGGGPPVAAPLQIGISGVRRLFDVPPFHSIPSDVRIALGGQGLAIQAFVPIVPSHGDDLGNSLSATVQLTSGSGLSDMYTGLTGGVDFPLLPNPAMLPPVPYPANIAPGIISFDALGTPHSIEWRTLVLGAQYHLPVALGRRVWVSALYSRTTSDNAKALSPFPEWGRVWTSARYYDANAFVAVTRALQVALSWQLTRQQYAAPFVNMASNVRGQLAATYFF
jgi:hypothetical protein